MSIERALIITSDPAYVLTFNVLVGDRTGESRHWVSLSSDDAACYA